MTPFMRVRCPYRSKPGAHDALDLALPMSEVSKALMAKPRCRCGAEMVMETTERPSAAGEGR